VRRLEAFFINDDDRRAKTCTGTGTGTGTGNATQLHVPVSIHHSSFYRFSTQVFYNSLQQINIMGTPLAGILTNTVSHDEEDAVERIANDPHEPLKGQTPDNNNNNNKKNNHIASTPQHKQRTANDDKDDDDDDISIPSVPSMPSPYSPPSHSLMSATEEWMMRRRSRANATNSMNYRKTQANNHNQIANNNDNKPPDLIHTTSTSWHEDDDDDDEEEDPILLQQKQIIQKQKAERQKLAKENHELKHQLQKQTHTLLQRSRDHEQRQKTLQQKWQSALLQLDKTKAMNHELKTNFQKQLQQVQVQADDWQQQYQQLQEQHQQQQSRRGKHVKEPVDAACQTDVIPANMRPPQNTVACQTESPKYVCSSIACQTDEISVVPAIDAGTQTDPTQLSSTLEERLGRIRDAAERAALVQEHQAALQQLQTTHDEEMERLEKQHEAAMAQMVQQARQHVQEQVGEHQQKMEQQHATKLAALEAKHQAELFRVRLSFFRFSSKMIAVADLTLCLCRFDRNTKKVPKWQRKSCEQQYPKPTPQLNNYNAKWKHALH
jgi:hypothetical protein